MQILPSTPTNSGDYRQEVSSGFITKVRGHYPVDQEKAIEGEDGRTDCPDSPRAGEKCALTTHASLQDSYFKERLAKNAATTAAAVQTFFDAGCSALRSFFIRGQSVENLQTETRVQDPDFVLAQKYSWAVKGYEKIIAKGHLTGSPGPGNGYFETVRLLFEQIEVLCIKRGNKIEFEREPYWDFIESLFPSSPQLTRCRYPAIFYFIAMRMMEEKNSPYHPGLDFWQVSIEPSPELLKSGITLLTDTHLMFHNLRQHGEVEFNDCYPAFELSWGLFYEALKRESRQKSYCWCPDICIHVLLTHLDWGKQGTKARAAERVASYFDEISPVILQAIVGYPQKLENNERNNRAYNIARLAMELSLTTLDLIGKFTHEVNILKL